MKINKLNQQQHGRKNTEKKITYLNINTAGPASTVCAEKLGTLAEFNRRSLKLNNSSMEEEIYIILFFPDQLIVYITGFKPNFYFLTFLHWTTVNQSCRTIF